MGYRGKVKEQEKARALRAQNRTLADIAQTLGVSKSSVSLWVRDVPFTPTLRLRGPHRRPHPAHDEERCSEAKRSCRPPKVADLESRTEMRFWLALGRRTSASLRYLQADAAKRSVIRHPTQQAPGHGCYSLSADACTREPIAR